MNEKRYAKKSNMEEFKKADWCSRALRLPTINEGDRGKREMKNSNQP